MHSPNADSKSKVNSAVKGVETSIKINLQIPRIKTEAYFRPYVVVWLETAKRQPVETLALWYQVDSASSQEDGGKWLKDLRQWWRKIGRNEQAEYDVVTGATRRPGKHKISWQSHSTAVLAPGDYFLNFEAAREEAGRTFHRLGIQVKDTPSKQIFKIAAENEFGEISIQLEN